MKEIKNEYININKETKEIWCLNPNSGTNVAAPYDRSLKGITSGGFFDGNLKLKNLLDGLRNISLPLSSKIEIVDLNSLHFTFLALSPLVYNHFNNLSDEVQDIKDIFDKYVKGHILKIHNLQLVYFSNTLLLAGTPSEESYKLRALFAEKVLNSKAKSLLEHRYHGIEIPPKLWHTSLVRSNSEFFSQRLRDFILENERNDFGDAAVEVGLFKCNYNWKDINNL